MMCRRSSDSSAKNPEAWLTCDSSSLRSVARRDFSSSLFSAASAAALWSALAARASAAVHVVRALAMRARVSGQLSQDTQPPRRRHAAPVHV